MSTDLDDGLSATDDGPPAEQEAERKNLYGSVYQFVSDFLAQIYAREVSDRRPSFRWCPQWHHHAEAVARLEACWKAFEVLRVDPGTGSSVWFRDHLDPAMAALTSPEGPFRLCTDHTHQTLAALRSDPLPEWKIQ